MSMVREPEPTDPRRVKAFARFFKSYMSVSTIVVAALPIPITKLGAIPTYAAQTGSLATYTSLFCFLLLGFIFACRHALARAMFRSALFPDRYVSRWRRIWDGMIIWLPAILVLISVTSALGYMATLNRSLEASHALSELAMPELEGWEKLRLVPVDRAGVPERSWTDWAGETRRDLTLAIVREDSLLEWAARLFIPRSERRDSVSLATLVLAAARTRRTSWRAQDALQTLEAPEIPFAGRLMRFYLATFLCAEGAFILMAIREYLQDLLALSEQSLILSGHEYVGPEAS